MPAYRFYSTAPFDQPTLTLEGEEAHHLATVMRRQTGDRVELVDGKGSLAQANVLKISRRSALLEIITWERCSPPPREIILAQALPTWPRLKGITEKATELGVTKLWLFPGQRSEKQAVTTSQMEVLETIAIGALKQSGRTYLPTIERRPPLTEWTKLSLPAFFGDLASHALPFLAVLQTTPPPAQLVFVVGPEAGLSRGELDHLKLMHAQGVSLHPNVLRAETAPLVALSLISAAYGF